MTTQYNIVSYGTLTNTNGVLSDFSASNYATIPLTFNPVQHPYEMVFKVNTGTMPTDANGIIWQTGDISTARGRLDLEVYEDKLYAEYAANEDLVWNIDGITTLSSNTNYYIKFTYDGVNTYGLYISTDGTTWTTEGTTTSSSFLGDGTAEYNIIGVQPDEGGMIVPWFGSIDLNESYIDINNIRWWQGATSVSNVQTRIQLRHDTATNWASVNPVLLVGEVGIETDTRKQKFGDGSTSWNSLPYDANSTALNSKADTDLSNLSSTGKAVIDGQWVSSAQGIITSSTSLNGSTNLTYTVQVPDDGHVYEVLLRGEIETGSSSGNYCILSVQSNQLSSDWCYICGNRTRTTSSVGNQGSVIIPIKRANNNLTVRRNSGYNGNATDLKMLAYRRVGTNT